METRQDGSGGPWRRALRLGGKAALRNRVPALFLWLFGVGLIAGYYLFPPVSSALQQLQVWKAETGLLFAAVSTGLFAGAIPLGMSRLAGQSVPRPFVPYLTSNILFWAVKGVEIELFYRLQAVWFGDNSQWSTIVAKVFVDQVFYAPLVGLLNVVLFYRWRDRGYSGTDFVRGLNGQWYRDEFLPVLIGNWLVWLPACGLIYCLPQGLQLPIQNLILCFWVLILMFFTETESGSTPKHELTADIEGS